MTGVQTCALPIWPEKAGDNYQQWSQTSNPMLSHPVEGYQAISAPYTNNGWGGLEQQPGGPSLMDGTINHGNWFYAVGAASAWGGGFPGAFEAESVVELHVMCPPGDPPPPPADGYTLIMRQTAGFYQDNAAWSTDFGAESDDNYSILSQLESWRGAANGKFHLKLVYPDMADGRTDGNFNEWQQTTNFVTATANGVDGYVPVSISYTLLGNVDAVDNDDGNWYGLEHNTDASSVGDGSVEHGYWFYAIGSSGEWSGGIPGGTWTAETKVELHALWPVEDIPPPPPPPPPVPPEGWKVMIRQNAADTMPTADWVRYNADGDRATESFSVLDELEGCRGDDGKLALAIVWPQRDDCPHGDGEICGNVWRQTTNPVLEPCDTDAADCVVEIGRAHV